MTSATAILPLNSRNASRRISHGSMAFASEPNHIQPQDGAMQASVVTMKPHDRSQQVEPEDAALTGMTRSLFRRVMGLNVLSPAAPKKIAPVQMLTPRASRVA
ncbi:hypothetical protein ACFQBQ_14050 [Granulicella cerasi]|uniref:Uncharacterized protein n=1 Tax=Granulicella cerasi TaxID=741063 RepID=A0ABW1ZC68_9BACT|nr:hypothetical protein [Granulicella cerasi]